MPRAVASSHSCRARERDGAGDARSFRRDLLPPPSEDAGPGTPTSLTVKASSEFNALALTTPKSLSLIRPSSSKSRASSSADLRGDGILGVLEYSLTRLGRLFFVCAPLERHLVQFRGAARSWTRGSRIVVERANRRVQLRPPACTYVFFIHNFSTRAPKKSFRRGVLQVSDSSCGTWRLATKEMLSASSSMLARLLARRSAVRRGPAQLRRAMSGRPCVGWNANVATSLSPSIEDMGYGKIANFPLFHDLVQEHFADYGEVRACAGSRRPMIADLPDDHDDLCWCRRRRSSSSSSCC